MIIVFVFHSKLSFMLNFLSVLPVWKYHLSKDELKRLNDITVCCVAGAARSRLDKPFISLQRQRWSYRGEGICFCATTWRTIIKLDPQPVSRAELSYDQQEEMNGFVIQTDKDSK